MLLGVAVVAKEKALLWTDGRYHLQASQQLDSNWTLMKQGVPNVPTLTEWLKKVQCTACEYSLPSPAWAEDTVLSLCVCVLPQNCCKLQLSQNLNKLQVTNLVI